MKLKDLLLKLRNILPFLAFPIALDSHRMAREVRDERRQKVSNEIAKLIEQLKNKDNIIIRDQIIKNKIAGLNADVSEHLEKVTQNSRIIESLIKKLDDQNIDEQEREFITGLIKNNTEEKIDTLEKANKILEEINDLLTLDGNNFVNQFNFLLSKFKEFLSTLDVEQLAAVVNIIGYIIIISSLIGIAAVLYGEFLIQYFKIEEKFPKLSAFIKIRRKFQ